MVAEDRRVLRTIMDTPDVPARRYKIYGGWTAERLGRLKLNGALYQRSGLSTVIELESLRLGVEGKALLRRTLLAVATWDDQLDTAKLRDVLQRADRQIETLYTLRSTAAVTVFSR
ncbi:hypothetical protein ACFWFU_13590 [Streptomyces sp. NPDC060235]|uniref:hypothetical protein n=1 Tax=Streptomyces sp. NPDC060235 TaxID=3347080 RepID=UPI003655CEF5